jgi:hypothetical protein
MDTRARCVHASRLWAEAELSTTSLENTGKTCCVHASKRKAEKRKMILDLQAVFGADPTDRAPAPTGPEPSGGDKPAAPIHPIDAWLWGQDWSRWRFEGGRLIGPDANPADDWDALPEPGPACPRCGSLDFSVDLLGGRHCGRCEAQRLARSRRLAEKAERLRRAAPPKKPASPVAPGCEETRADDTQPAKGPSPSAAILGPLGRREDRQGQSASCGK